MGQLAPLDASPFAWLEDRGPTAALHGLIDDATSIPLALWVRPTEDLHGYTTVLGQTCRQYGVPVTLYGDRLNLFRRNDRYLGEELRLLFDGEAFKKDYEHHAAVERLVSPQEGVVEVARN